MGTVTRLSGQELVTEFLARAASLCEDWPEFRTAVGDEAQTEARKTVRKKTRRLEESIVMVDTGVAVHIYTDLSYAWPVHAGVPREGLAPNRFLLPLAYELDPTPLWEQMAADQLGG